MRRFLLLSAILCCSISAGQSRRGVSAPGLTRTKLVMEVHDMTTCGNSKDNALSVSELVVRRLPNKEYTFSYNFTLNRDGNNITRMAVKLTKCAGQVSSNTCEYFQTWNMGDACRTVFDKHVFWSPYIATIKPEVKCPMKQGNYTCKDAHLDTDLLQLLPMPLEGNEWIWNLNIFDQNDDPYFCLRFLTSFKRIRL